jgi:hypothetical protein
LPPHGGPRLPDWGGTIGREKQGTQSEGTAKTSVKILQLLQENPEMTLAEVAKEIQIAESH